MTETKPTAGAHPSDTCILPADALLNAIAALIAPVFLTATGGDVTFARMAAVDTINSYRATSQPSLLAVAQIVAFGLAALGSLSLSMADDLTMEMVLRLRANANALHRSAEQNRRAMAQIQTDGPAPNANASHDAMDRKDHARDAAAIAGVQAARKAVVAAQLAVSRPAMPTDALRHAASTILSTQAQPHRAISGADVAGELTAYLSSLPLAERKIASHRAALMSSTATALLSGESPPNPRRPATSA